MQTSTLEATTSEDDTTFLPDEPLAIRVTVPAQQNLALRALVRQAIPMLRSPESYGKETRLQLAQTLTQALESGLGDNGADELDWDGPLFTDAEAPPDEADATECCCPCGGCEWSPE